MFFVCLFIYMLAMKGLILLLKETTKPSASVFSATSRGYNLHWHNRKPRDRFEIFKLYLRWFITVSTTFQEVDFDGSLLPLFII